MGLDMYAYKLKAEYAPAKDKDVFKAVLEAIDFETADEDELSKMTDEQKTAYYQRKREAEQQAKEQGIFDPEFAYWRKFNALHAWMEDLWLSRGNDGTFNCCPMRLHPDDLDELQDRVDSRQLEPRSGFFFGSTDELDDNDYANVQNFITKARQAIADGYAVYYDSWW